MFNGAAAYGDGEVIEANKDRGVEPIDPRTPKGFWDPFFRQINVEQKVELDSIMSVHEVKAIREENGKDLVAEIASGWKYLYGKEELGEFVLELVRGTCLKPSCVVDLMF